jgi:GntR family transcriptional regulator
MEEAPWAEELRRRLAESAPGQPRYRRLQLALAELIDAGLAVAGGALPGEREIARITGLSRVTVRKALAGLTAEGRVRPRAGAGTYVGERIERSFSRLTGFTEDLRARGLDPRVVFLERGVGKATPDEAMALSLTPGAPVVRLHRLRYAGDRPMAIERTSVPQAILPAPELVESSLYEALERLGQRPRRALQRLRAVAMDAERARLLGLEPGSPGLEIERRAFLADGRAVEFTRSLYRADAYDFVAELEAR